MLLPDPDCSPILSVYLVTAPALATACRRAATHESDAADIVCTRSIGRAGMALTASMLSRLQVLQDDGKTMSLGDCRNEPVFETDIIG